MGTNYQKAIGLTTRGQSAEQFMVYWIIGYGRVGRRALTRLRHKSPEAVFTVVDPRLSRPPEKMKNVRWHRQDGVAFLMDHHPEMTTDPSPWIVPALPLHLAFEWVVARIRKTGSVSTIPVPTHLVAQLPNAVVGPDGQAYVSNADFICPVNCSEPDDNCPATGQARPCDLYAFLGDLRIEDCRSVVVRSHQLAPGVGGYRGCQLEEALRAIQTRPGKVLLSTASKCHGVVHALTLGMDKG